MRATRTGTLLIAALLTSCGSAPATQVLVHFEAEPTLRAAARSLRIQVIDDRSVTTYDQTRTAAELAWPATLPVSPASETSSSFAVVGALVLEDDTVVRVSARTHFVRDARRHVWLVLHPSCVGIDCSADAGASTCRDGTCVDACAEPADEQRREPLACELDGGTPSDGAIEQDAGCVDGERCGGDSGICRGGACCTGCWDGSACRTDRSAALCGRGGETCVACPCAGDSCVDGACSPPADRAALTVSTWWHRSCASGSLERTWCWGLDDVGQVGDGAPPSPRPPTYIGTFGSVLLGSPRHTCAFNGEGARWCWGDGAFGALGLSDGASTDVPRRGADSIDWAEVRTGYDYTCGLGRSPSEVHCWGNNADRQLALPATTTSTPIPTRVTRGDGSAPIYASFDVGLYFVVAITEGHVEGWGSNSRGELARDPSSTRSLGSPTEIMLPEPVRSATGGNAHACAIGESGVAYCWGAGGPSLGPRAGDLPWVPEPVSVPTGERWSILSAGGDHTCGVDELDRLWCWGENASGQLGNGLTSASSVPVPVDTSLAHGNRTWEQISAGAEATCAIATGGSVYCWGTNADGVLGVPTTVAMGIRPARVCLPTSF